MTSNHSPAVDWQHWLERWDNQQTGYIPHREERFQAMFDVLEILLPENFVALDLACGPGAISKRLLERFPHARCVAIDLDPVLLAIGQGTLGHMNSRLRWVEADLTQDDWVEKLGESQFDAVLSTTALHWLPGGALLQVYRRLGELVRSGGVFLNGDSMPFPSHLAACSQLAKTLQTRQEKEAFETRGKENWQEWWQAIEQEPELNDLLTERQRRFGERHTDFEPILNVHEAGLHNAGFREVSTIWQRLDERVLLAVR
ncbi:class I SAM-dependent methyltransferase [Oculatella sp. LEGE 06141]|uniref:class I SAM-dependent methyltransferase n=1 Tax=Oculatella sp. LEGE 06141 TaxID=1828648 RepID=UPI00188012B4|nr:class I SAM-dependent methyltransferase [Oculatella sp. LEGE 06141]MBE9178139.1 class I SAM-dependent methyltransferase [Oculatella sp. LEGE 06141]